MTTKTVKKKSAVWDPVAIEKKSKAFAKLSAKKKRLAIARDVIAQVRAKRFVAYPGTYAYIASADNKESPAWLQEFLVAPPPASSPCEVCGIGAAFLSRAKLGNNLHLRMDHHEELRDIFSEKEQWLIETAFESTDIGPYTKPRRGDRIDEQLVKRAYSYADKYPDDNKRLVAIFKNILRNDGTFKP